ncbi:hypothetical protein BDR04DRAFT_1107782 [Suillus decipiens]|nr:hypothetical protein BDR04DRAFT_1107782 [Suillus decipiens]
MSVAARYHVHQPCDLDEGRVVYLLLFFIITIIWLITAYCPRIQSNIHEETMLCLTTATSLTL